MSICHFDCKIGQVKLLHEQINRWRQITRKKKKQNRMSYSYSEFEFRNSSTVKRIFFRICKANGGYTMPLPTWLLFIVFQCFWDPFCALYESRRPLRSLPIEFLALASVAADISIDSPYGSLEPRLILPLLHRTFWKKQILL